MAEYDNNMRGVLFKNERKVTDNDPDYTGSAEIDGVDMWLSAWIKERKQGGGKFMSLSFKAKDAPKNPPAKEPVKQTRAQGRTVFDDMDSDIPF